MRDGRLGRILLRWSEEEVQRQNENIQIGSKKKAIQSLHENGELRWVKTKKGTKLTSYELNVFLFVEFSSNNLSKRSISEIRRLEVGVNGFSCSLSKSYSLIISSKMPSNLFRTLIQALRSDRGHFQESIWDKTSRSSLVEVLISFVISSAT